MADASTQAAAPSEVAGIYDLAATFGPIYLAITRGVYDATPAEVDADDWEDVLEDTLGDAWDLHRSDPGYFADIPPRQWARSAAHFRFSKRVRTDRRRANRDEVFVREFLPSYFHPDVLDDLIRMERGRAVARAWQVLAPRTRSVLDAIILKGLSRRAAAALLGLSERMIKRELDEGRPQLALMLTAWDPRAARTRRRCAPTREADLESRALFARAPAPLPLSHEEQGDYE